MGINHALALKKIAPFDTLSHETLLQLVNSCQAEVYPKNSYVFRQGDPSRQVLFLIVQGLAEVIITNEKGLETVAGFRRQYDFFGETGLLTGKSYPTSLKAAEELHCLLLPREIFERLLESYPSFAGFFAMLLTDRFRDLYQEVLYEQSYEAYSVDTHPFNKRASQLMSAPAITCSTEDTVQQAAAILAENKISSLIVTDQSKQPVGILTETDLVAKAVVRGDCRGMLVKEVMNPRLITLPPHSFFNRVLLAMIKNAVKHVAVLDGDHLSGIITISDLMKSRSTGTLSVIDYIETKNTIEELVRAGKEIDKMLNALVAEKAPVPEIFEVMSEFHDRLTRRIIFIAEREMVQEGYGPAPAPYCWMNMGSGGRMEQTLRTDQDNALVYEVPEGQAEEDLASYFHILAEKVVNGLVRCGFSRCNGGVMASNPKWCRSLTDWKNIISDWIKTPEPENVRFLSILLDLRPIYGTGELALAIRRHIQAAGKASPVIFRFLAQDDLDFKIPIGLLGQIITDKSPSHENQINLKRSGYLHLINCIRVLALRYGVEVPTTLGRLRELEKRRLINLYDAEYLNTAFQSLIMLSIRENLRKVAKGEEPDYYLHLSRLSPAEKTVLKDSLKAITKLQQIVGSSLLIF